MIDLGACGNGAMLKKFSHHVTTFGAYRIYSLEVFEDSTSMIISCETLFSGTFLGAASHNLGVKLHSHNGAAPHCFLVPH